MEQHYANHRRLVPGFHYFCGSLLLACIGLAIAYLSKHGHNTGSILIGIMLLLLPIIMGVLAFYSRRFALIAQDRAIRAEESLRLFVLTGKLPDPRLEMGQIIALRFATDEEFVALTASATAEGWSSNQIKKAIQTWRADHHRV